MEKAEESTSRQTKRPDGFDSKPDRSTSSDHQEVGFAAQRHLEQRTLGRRGLLNPATLLHLQHTSGNQAAAQLLSEPDGHLSVLDVVGKGRGSPLDPTVQAELSAARGEQVVIRAPVTGAHERTSEVGPGPVKTASGLAALRTLQVIESAQSFTYEGGALGAVTLVPGSIINSRILLYASPSVTYYIEGTDVYEISTGAFVRDLWLTGLAEGAAGAAWLVPIAQAEFALLEGLFVPWWIVGGVTILEGCAFVHQHLAQLRQIRVDLRLLSDLRNQFKTRFPTLYDKCFWMSIHEVVQDLPEGVALSDVAYFMGRVLGTQGLLKEVGDGAALSARVAAKILAEYAILVSLIHGPEIAKRGIEAKLKTRVADLRAAMAQSGIPLTEAEAMTILRELERDPGVNELLCELDEASQHIDAELKSLNLGK